MTPESAAVAEKEGRSYDTCKMFIAMKECGADTILDPGFEKLIGMFAEPN